MFQQQRKSSATSRFTLKLKAKSWCALVALITALAFISLISIAATHHHSTVQESQDCSFCSAVSDKIGGNLAAPSLFVASFFVLFRVAVQTLRSTFYVTSKLFPPSCGPPSIA
ncbi:hypothetical protein [Solimicrobium silvestre]|uniref:hypothetical protein n=1 Tax=Solimicrobium silvestre TaxID=2099400 RepID=UPI000CFB1795|nr:hypothetical protein [Solimicrobium silvestre]